MFIYCTAAFDITNYDVILYMLMADHGFVIALVLPQSALRLWIGLAASTPATRYGLDRNGSQRLSRDFR